MFEHILLDALTGEMDYSPIAKLITNMQAKELVNDRPNYRCGFFSNTVYADTNNYALSAAVITIYNTLIHAGMNPGTDVWVNKPEHRSMIFDLIRFKWTELTKRRFVDFPFTEGITLHLWTTYRKASSDKEKPRVIRTLVEYGLLPETPFPGAPVQYIFNSSKENK